MTTTQQPRAVVWSDTELRELFLVVSDAPPLATRSGSVRPTSLRVVFSRATDGDRWTVRTVGVLGSGLGPLAGHVLHIDLAAAGIPAPDWLAALVAAHMPASLSP